MLKRTLLAALAAMTVPALLVTTTAHAADYDRGGSRGGYERGDRGDVDRGRSDRPVVVDRRGGDRVIIVERDRPRYGRGWRPHHRFARGPWWHNRHPRFADRYYGGPRPRYDW